MLIPCDKPSTAVKGKKRRSHKAKARHRNTTTLTGLADSKTIHRGDGSIKTPHRPLINSSAKQGLDDSAVHGLGHFGSGLTVWRSVPHPRLPALDLHMDISTVGVVHHLSRHTPAAAQSPSYLERRARYFAPQGVIPKTAIHVPTTTSGSSSYSQACRGLRSSIERLQAVRDVPTAKTLGTFDTVRLRTPGKGAAIQSRCFLVMKTSGRSRKLQSVFEFLLFVMSPGALMSALRA